MEEEIWKDIVGYEGKYQVSNLGNVRSLNYNNTGKIRNLKPKTNRYGYLEVKLSKNNKTKNFLVSTLVGNTFLDNNGNKPKIMHKNGNTIDNTVYNLKRAYISEIKFNMYKNGKRIIGKPSGNKISYKGKAYKTYAEIAKNYEIDSDRFLHRINRGWSIDEALDIPILTKHGKPAKFYKYYDKGYTLKQLSKKFNIPEKLIRGRLRRGWDIYSAVETPNLTGKDFK